MFLLLRLLLGHMVGDFLLQTDEIYQAKKKSKRGIFLHALIIFLCLLVFSFPYATRPEVLLIITIAAIAHGIQDTLKIKFIHKGPELLIFVLDQALHVLFLTPILLFSYASIAPSSETIFHSLYNNDSLILLALCFIISTIMGKHLWAALQYTLSFKHLEQTKLSVRCSMLERLIVTISFLKPVFLLVIAIPLFIRIYKKIKPALSEIAFNVFFASLLGLILRKFLLQH